MSATAYLGVQVEPEVLEEWKQELYACPTVYKAFKFFEKLGLKKPQLLEFADYLEIDVYKYGNKTSIIRKLVYSTVGERLKDAPVRRRNIEKYNKDTATHGWVVFTLSLRGDINADNLNS